MKLSEKIRIIRKARGFSQEELGFKLQKKNSNGISRQTVSDWENGKCEPVLDNIRNLCDVLDVSFDTLLDDSIDLSDKNVLNSALKHLSDSTKNKINNSNRYHIYAYTVTIKDYIKVVIYFALLVASIILIIIGLCSSSLGPSVEGLLYIGLILTFSLLGVISLPISWIRKIKRGGHFKSFGTLSQTHFVMISWSDMKFDRTIYIPVSQIESMELDKNATKKHGVVIVHVKGNTRPMLTNDIVNPNELIKVFNNFDTFIDIGNVK